MLRRGGGHPRRRRPARPLHAEHLQLAAAHPPDTVRVHHPHVGPRGQAGGKTMNEPEPISEELKGLIDQYLSGLLDEAGVAALEGRLRNDPEARRYYVRYARLHTDLHLEAHARQATARALDQLDPDRRPHAPREEDAILTRSVRSTIGGRLVRILFRPRTLVAAACLLLAVGVVIWLLGGFLVPNPQAPVDQAIAGLVNAQNCTWADGEGPEANWQAGKVLKLERGLAEIRFGCGARVVLEGPARLELLSARSARLLSGKLTARVPPGATGFELLSPKGRVIDLGTEFGIAVADDGTTDVFVFQGKVEAHPVAGAGEKGVTLTQTQAARIDAGQVTQQPATGADQFVRAIVPPPAIVPRTLRLAFNRTPGGSI